MAATPTFSFVATSRNDDHGGDVLRRTQSFIKRLAEQCERHQVPCELVLVDWNPPQSRAPLAEVLAWPAGSEWFSARIVTVPPALHREFAYSKRLAMFQMIAKNVGIRRARGDYMIATNIDIIFSDELFQWLKSGVIRPGVLYRSDRWDIPNEIQLEPDLDTLLARARNEHIRRNLSTGTHVRRDGEFVNTYGNRFDHSVYYPMEGILIRLKALIADQPTFDRDDMVRSLGTIIAKDLPQLRRDFFIPTLHTNGCGDFTMMARQDWFALRGYPEWHVFSWNIDSVIVYQAHYNSMPIEELDGSCVHYHIEHDNGSGWTPEGAASLWARLTERGLPLIDYRQFYEIIYALQDNAEAKRFSVYNDVDWGLDGREVECRTLVEPDSPARPPAAVNAGRLDEDFLKTLLPVTPGIRFDGGERAVDDVLLEWRTADDGEAELAVESLPAMWSYAFYYDLMPLAQRSGEYWVKVQIIVDQGNVAVGVLNRDKSDFLSQVTYNGAGPRVQDVYAHIREIGEASQIVFRNLTPDGQPARFRLRGVGLLREDTAADDAATAGGQEVEAKRAAGLTFALQRRDDPVRPPEREPLAQLGATPKSAPAFEPGVARLAEIRATAPGVIVRVLRSRPDRAADPSEECQVMIILPGAVAGDAGAVLDLGGSEYGASKVGVRLHVLEGEAAIGLKARATGEILAESRERAGPPLTQIDLDANGAEAACALVIRNTSPSSPVKLLLHQVELNAAAGR